MTKADYQEYLKTPGWRKRRQWVLIFWNHRCALCNSEDRVEVHHRDYSRLGHEKLTDCITLCHNHHGFFHNIPSVKAYESLVFTG